MLNMPGKEALKAYIMILTTSTQDGQWKITARQKTSEFTRQEVEEILINGVR
jgi:hypothetical protein